MSIRNQIAAAPATAAPAPASRVALAGLSLATLLAAFGTSAANVALPTLSTALAVSFQAVQWVVLAYLLAVTTLAVSVGRLGDLLGRRRLLLAGMALFSLASAAAALAPGWGMLVAARALQGLGAAVMMVLSMALVGEAVGAAQTGRAMGLLGTMSAVGTALGPALGGVLIASFGWRSLFLVQVPFGLLVLALTWLALPAEPRGMAGRATAFDGGGSVLLAASLAAYALALTLGRGHFGWLNGGLVLIAVLGAVGFWRFERAHATPLVRPQLLREPTLAASLLAALLVASVVMATLVVGPFHLTRALGLDATRVGLALSVGPLVAALAGVPAGQLTDRWGAGPVIRGGLGAMVAGVLLLAAVPTGWGVPGYLVPLVIVTAGYAAFQAANNTALLGGVAVERRGVVSGLLNLSRNLGLITGAALMGAVFAGSVGAVDPGSATPAAVATGTRVTFALAGVLLLGALCPFVRRRAAPA